MDRVGVGSVGRTSTVPSQARIIFLRFPSLCFYTVRSSIEYLFFWECYIARNEQNKRQSCTDSCHEERYRRHTYYTTDFLEHYYYNTGNFGRSGNQLYICEERQETYLFLSCFNEKVEMVRTLAGCETPLGMFVEFSPQFRFFLAAPKFPRLFIFELSVLPQQVKNLNVTRNWYVYRSVEKL